MNKDLEKLVEYALVDGYISDKEKKVLIKKATEQGFDIDELEMILEGKLQEAAYENAQKVDKCPSCGEIMNGLSKVCTSCDYVVDAKEKKKNVKTLDRSLDEINEELENLKFIPEPTGRRAVQVALATFFTGGIYLIYNKLANKYIIDKEYGSFKRDTEAIRIDVQNLKQTYGNDNQINQILSNIENKLNEKDAARNKKNIIISCTSFVLIALMSFFAYKIYTMPPSPEKIAENKIKLYIKNRNISQAKAMLGRIDKEDKESYEQKIIKLEIDSLLTLKDYNQAILLTEKLEKIGYTNPREEKVDSIITLEVKELIEKKDFNRARERVYIAHYPVSFELTRQIDLNETIENDNKKKHKK